MGLFRQKAERKQGEREERRQQDTEKEREQRQRNEEVIEWMNTTHPSEQRHLLFMNTLGPRLLGRYSDGGGAKLTHRQWRDRRKHGRASRRARARNR